MIIDSELTPEDVAAIDAAVEQEDIPLTAEMLQALREWADVPSYAERYTPARMAQALQRVIIASSRVAMLAQYEATGERYEFCKGCGKPLQGYFNQCNQYPECVSLCIVR